MFCLECGQEIPDHSKYCLHCGVAVSAAQSAANTTPTVTLERPLYVSNAELSLIGPVERKPGKGFLASEQIGRWLSFKISLANERGDLHRASGWIVLIINPFTKLPKMEKALNDASVQERLTFFGKFAVGIGEPQGARLGHCRYSEEFVYFNSSESYTGVE